MSDVRSEDALRLFESLTKLDAKAHRVFQSAAGMKFTPFCLLDQVASHPGQQQIEHVRNIGLPSWNHLHHFAWLEKQGFVERWSPSGIDRREVFYRITKTGKQALSTARKQGGAAIKALLDEQGLVIIQEKVA